MKTEYKQNNDENDKNKERKREILQRSVEMEVSVKRNGK